MTNIRALRLSHGLTLVDLALLTDIPVRTLAEIEYGIQRLDYESQSRLARVFELPLEQLCAGAVPAPRAARKAGWQRHAAPALAIALASVLLVLDPLAHQLPALSAARAGQPGHQRIAAPNGPPRPAELHAALLAATPALATATAQPPTPALATATAQPPRPTQLPPTPTPRFVLAEDGPHGCPLAPATGHTVMTQGYGVGTHEPASIWGAVDLAIDGDGDGNVDPDATQGAPIFATHDGVAHITLDSWPGGNFVRVVDEQDGWSTAYAHLDSVFVVEGQAISAGATIGAVGSTGMTSGPHLHYEVWHGGENVDPSGLIGCE
jgi:murein DD-endopeptidase MepM/ murein hydrolase activator NlpD